MATQAECRSALSLYEGSLLEFRNVIGTGIISDPELGEEETDARFLVAVYVVQKIPYDDLDPDDVLPSYLQVCDDLKGVYKVPTRVIETGPQGGTPGALDNQTLQ